MCVIDLDPCQVWNEVVRTARTPKCCHGCGARIHQGDAYLDHSSLHDGYWTRQACCFVCWWIRADFGTAHEDMPVPNGIVYVLRECADYDGDRRWRRYASLMYRRINAARRGAA